MMWGLRGCGGCSFLCFYTHNPTLHFPARPWCIGLWNRITGWANFTSIKDPIILVSALRSCVGGALWRVPTLSVAIIFLTWCNYFCWRLTINVTDWLITSWPLVIISSLLLLSTVSWPGLGACTYNDTHIILIVIFLRKKERQSRLDDGTIQEYFTICLFPSVYATIFACLPYILAEWKRICATCYQWCGLLADD